MLDTKIAPTDDIAPEKLKEPSKRWRNKYRALRHITDVRTNTHHDPDDEFWENSVWPSHEIAEQKAKARIAASARHNGRESVKWVDAFPEADA